MSYKVTYQFKQGSIDACTIPYAFCEAAARYLAMLEGNKKYPNYGIQVINVEPLISNPFSNFFK